MSAQFFWPRALGVRRDISRLADDGKLLPIEPARAPTSMLLRSSGGRFYWQIALPQWGPKLSGPAQAYPLG